MYFLICPISKIFWITVLQLFSVLYQIKFWNLEFRMCQFFSPLFQQTTRGRYSRGHQQSSHLSTAVAWREKKFKHFVFNKYFCLVLGVLKSKISKKSFESLLRKLDFKLFHYKAMVQPVSKITTIATRNRCWM